MSTVATGQVALRPACADDEPLLRELFAQDRLPVLVDLQYAARRQQYAAVYPTAEDLVIELDGRACGRLLVAESGDGSEVRVVDIAVLHDVRRRGVARAALRPWLEQARAGGSSVVLSVATDNPAAHAFHQALGFVPGADATHDAAYVQMRLDPEETHP